MTDNSHKAIDRAREEKTVARLMRLAGESESIPTDIESRVYERVVAEWESSSAQPDSERVYANVRREWNRTPARSRVRRWALPVALAASVVLAVAVVLQPAPPVPSNVPIGTIVKNLGNSSRQTAPGSPVYPGETVMTGEDGGLSIRLANAESLRLDASTKLAVLTGNAFRLIEGRVYADTGEFMYRDKGLIIETSLGTVTDVGTQFSVHEMGQGLVVAVREGRVDVVDGAHEHIAVAGERVTLEPGMVATVSTLDSHDEYWEWVTDLSPSYDIENRSLLDFLRWAARETGRELEFEDNELRMAAMRTDLHGSVQGFSPADAVAAVMATTPTFRYRMERDKIVVSRK